MAISAFCAAKYAITHLRETERSHTSITRDQKSSVDLQHRYFLLMETDTPKILFRGVDSTDQDKNSHLASMLHAKRFHLTSVECKLLLKVTKEMT